MLGKNYKYSVFTFLQFLLMHNFCEKIEINYNLKHNGNMICGILIALAVKIMYYSKSYQREFSSQC
jgi:hypothetical protein